jgi:hypothetical protein
MTDKFIEEDEKAFVIMRIGYGKEKPETEKESLKENIG